MKLLNDHPLRQLALNETHARPFEPLDSPLVVFHQAFMAQPSGGSNRKAFAAWCENQNLPPPSTTSRHHVVERKDGIRLIWERHHEFITLSWDCPRTDGAAERLQKVAEDNETAILAANAERVALVELDVEKFSQDTKPEFTEVDRACLCGFALKDQTAVVTTDFKPDDNGVVHIKIHDLGLDRQSLGSLVRRLLEIETYRVLALIGFVDAKRIMPEVKNIEDQLIELTVEMGKAQDIEASRRLLKTITDIGSRLEAISASNQFRMSATRAYYGLVKFRLEKIGGTLVDEFMPMQDFLGRRLTPAMRTCDSIEERIALASKKLSRAANLLRTKVDIQLEAQNHQLLESMDRRAKQQFRLQQTVEGLSIAAVSYYVVSLIGYLVKGSEKATGIAPGMITAVSVPVVVVIIWWLVRRIKKNHGG